MKTMLFLTLTILLFINVQLLISRTYLSDSKIFFDTVQQGNAISLKDFFVDRAILIGFNHVDNFVSSLNNTETVFAGDTYVVETSLSFCNDVGNKSASATKYKLIEIKVYPKNDPKVFVLGSHILSDYKGN
ncbi:MAG: hypothetical protein PHR06_10265 [Candidatus Cloacimonetes bacterium]|nr:hypothetical protein [Candidatus Cloacimonadota bacterium]